MRQLSLAKKHNMIRLYIQGHTYSEIARRVGVSKGSVANVVEELRAGRFPEVASLAEEIEGLRELGSGLRRQGSTLGQALVGLEILATLNNLGIDPVDIQPWANLCRELAQGQAEAPAMVEALLHVHRVREDTGLDFQELAAKATELADKIEKLQPLVTQLQRDRQHLQKDQEQLTQVQGEVASEEKHLAILQQKTEAQERREAELAGRVGSLEDKAQHADEALATARKDLAKLGTLGLSREDLTALVEGIAVVADRHGVPPEEARHRFFQELEKMDEALGLEKVITGRQERVEDMETLVAEAEQQHTAMTAAVRKLKEERDTLHALIAEEKVLLQRHMRGIGKMLDQEIQKASAGLAKGVKSAIAKVRSVGDEALAVGEDLGRFQQAVEANEWLQGLLHLLNGDRSLPPAKARVVTTSVLRGFLEWLRANHGAVQAAALLEAYVQKFLFDVEEHVR